jgi:hypothetical protein
LTSEDSSAQRGWEKYRGGETPRFMSFGVVTDASRE